MPTLGEMLRQLEMGLATKLANDAAAQKLQDERNELARRDRVSAFFRQVQEDVTASIRAGQIPKDYIAPTGLPANGSLTVLDPTHTDHDLYQISTHG
jgi:hypothetical protein